MSSPGTLEYVPSCARGLCPNPVGNRPGSPLTTLSSSTCGQLPVAVLGIAVAVSPRVGNCQLQASCLPSSGKSEAGQLSALLGHGSRQAVNRHLGTPTPVPISRSPGPGTCKRLPATGSPVTIGHWGLASWPGPPSVTVMAGERWPSCIPPGPGQGPRGRLQDEALTRGVTGPRGVAMLKTWGPCDSQRRTLSETGRRCSAALVSLGEASCGAK